MKVERGTLEGVLLFEPKVHGDERGFFVETYNAARYAEAGLPDAFVQDNVSRSAKGVLRGLHLQHPQGQGKLVQVLDGAVYDVAVDVRVGSPTFGRWMGVHLDSTRKNQIYVPVGFAHGFCVTSDHALLSYKCTDLYAPDHELGVAWNDPGLSIDWPLEGEPTVSGRDQAHPRLRDIPRDRLPRYEAANR